jgi:parallel beta-helix repeat protein
VSQAGDGTNVKARTGTYTGGIVISSAIDLIGDGNPVLDATTSSNGVGIQITASGASVSGFTVENALDEGILVGDSSAAAAGSPVDGVTIDRVTVTGNDTGFSGVPGQGVGECFTSTMPNAAPGDCGEGLHLNSVTNSAVEHSTITGNAGGILVTDEFGPSSNDAIAYNTVVNNTHDCGITLASHNKPMAGPPSSFGIFHNTVEFNTVDGNGVVGQGGGILMAGGGPNTQVYGNTITYNEASGNGLAGVVIHLHVPGSNLNDNVITHNHLSNNNLDGDFDFFPAVDPEPTDIFVASATPLTGTVIEHNQLSDATYGIWTLNASSSTIDNNQFSNITTPISSS